MPTAPEMPLKNWSWPHLQKSSWKRMVADGPNSASLHTLWTAKSMNVPSTGNDELLKWERRHGSTLSWTPAGLAKRHKEAAAKDRTTKPTACAARRLEKMQGPIKQPARNMIMGRPMISMNQAPFSSSDAPREAPKSAMYLLAKLIATVVDTKPQISTKGDSTNKAMPRPHTFAVTATIRAVFGARPRAAPFAKYVPTGLMEVPTTATTEDTSKVSAKIACTKDPIIAFINVNTDTMRPSSFRFSGVGRMAGFSAMASATGS
mmetsp:Transcript_14084/g.26318  ORF Transcript_14084/g.26318 Transcript_14084/m.26318 type:complete len:262 (+) Transcript_14084:452-1237(+)